MRLCVLGFFCQNFSFISQNNIPLISTVFVPVSLILSFKLHINPGVGKLVCSMFLLCTLPFTSPVSLSLLQIAVFMPVSPFPLAALNNAITLFHFLLYVAHSHCPLLLYCTHRSPAASLPPGPTLPVACNWLSPRTGKAGGPRQAGGDPFPWGIQQPPNQLFSGAASFTLQLEQLPLWELHQ